VTETSRRARSPDGNDEEVRGGARPDSMRVHPNTRIGRIPFPRPHSVHPNAALQSGLLFILKGAVLLAVSYGVLRAGIDRRDVVTWIYLQAGGLVS
jgi:hypothetical protein